MKQAWEGKPCNYPLFQDESYRTVVGARYFGINESIFQTVFEAFGYQKVVNTPACIFGSGAEAVGPPGVDSFFVRIKITESIKKTGLCEDGEFFPFLVGETCIFAIGFWIFQVNFLMRYI